MPSPGNILDIKYSRVGSIDSSYYGITILDSDTSSITLNNDITNKSYSVDESILTFPNPLSIHQITGSTNLVSGSGSSGGGGGGGDGGGSGSSTAGERWE